MKSYSKTRKPANQLKVEDFSAFPVWEYAIDEEGVDGQDESWVRPVLSKFVPKESYSQLVFSRFRTNSGRDAHGYLVVTPTTSSLTNLSHSGGAIVTPKGQAFVAYFEGRMSESMKNDSVQRISRALNVSVAEIFPLHYELLVSIEGESKPRNGVFTYSPKA